MELVHSAVRSLPLRPEATSLWLKKKRPLRELCFSHTWRGSTTRPSASSGKLQPCPRPRPSRRNAKRAAPCTSGAAKSACSSISTRCSTPCAARTFTPMPRSRSTRTRSAWSTSGTASDRGEHSEPQCSPADRPERRQPPRRSMQKRAAATGLHTECRPAKQQGQLIVDFPGFPL